VILLSLWVLGVILSGLGLAVRKKVRFNRDLQSPFECGFSTIKEARLPFSLRFFVLALIFIIFDVELIILFPFLASYYFSRMRVSLLRFLIFLALLTFGLVNEWNQNLLEWTKFLRSYKHLIVTQETPKGLKIKFMPYMWLLIII
jgi:NADH:ubiquinone oxidoreductase subunit 3 (subunit A)